MKKIDTHTKFSELHRILGERGLHIVAAIDMGGFHIRLTDLKRRHDFSWHQGKTLVEAVGKALKEVSICEIPGTQ